MNTSHEEGWEERYEVGTGETNEIQLGGGVLLPGEGSDFDSSSNSSDDSTSAQKRKGKKDKNKKKKKKKKKNKKKGKKDGDDGLEEERQLEAQATHPCHYNLTNFRPAPTPFGGHRERGNGHVGSPEGANSH